MEPTPSYYLQLLLKRLHLATITDRALDQRAQGSDPVWYYHCSSKRSHLPSEAASSSFILEDRGLTGWKLSWTKHSDVSEHDDDDS